MFSIIHCLFLPFFLKSYTQIYGRIALWEMVKSPQNGRQNAASYLRVEAVTEGNVVGDTRQETSERDQN